MTPDELLHDLAQTGPAAPSALALASGLIEDARFPAHFALQNLLESIVPDARTKARSILAGARELALVPMARGESCGAVDDELWVIRTMTAELTSLRIRTTVAVRDLLANRGVLPSVKNGGHLQPPPGTRVCDVAYTLLHRLLHLAFDPAVFYGTTSDDRDAAIDRFKLSPAYRVAFEKQI